MIESKVLKRLVRCEFSENQEVFTFLGKNSQLDDLLSAFTAIYRFGIEK